MAESRLKALDRQIRELERGWRDAKDRIWAFEMRIPDETDAQRIERQELHVKAERDKHQLEWKIRVLEKERTREAERRRDAHVRPAKQRTKSRPRKDPDEWWQKKRAPAAGRNRDDRLRGDRER